MSSGKLCNPIRLILYYIFKHACKVKQKKHIIIKKIKKYYKNVEFLL